MPGRLQDKIAIITGSSSGLGRAISLAYAAEGAHLVLSDIREESRPESSSGEQGTTTLDAVTKMGGKATFVKCDTTKAEEVEELVKKAVEWGGRLDVMVNNAGVAAEGADPQPIWNASLDVYTRTLAVNTTGVFHGSKYASKQMLSQTPHVPSGDKGWIINMASILGLVATMSAPAYCASKHAVVGLTRSMALACGPERIHVNCICPGYVRTAMTGQAQKDAEMVDMLNKLHPFGNRMGEPEDIARAAVVLASDDARWINGLAMEVSGGYTAQ